MIRRIETVIETFTTWFDTSMLLNHRVSCYSKSLITSEIESSTSPASTEVGCAEIICCVEARLGVDPCAGDRGLECLQSLGAQADDQAGQHITCPGAGKGGRSNRDDGCASIGCGDDRECAFEHNHMSPFFCILGWQSPALFSWISSFDRSGQDGHFAGMRSQDGRRREIF